MEDQPEVIRQRMQENRTALTEKLEALEHQVMGVATSVTDTVESVKEGVQETVDSVKDTFQETVDSVKETVDETVESVKSTFDLPRQVEQHPWAMMAGAVGVGLLFGVLLRRRNVEKVSEAVGRRFRGSRSSAPRPALANDGGNGSGQASEPGATDQLLGTVKEGLTKVKDLALNTLFGTVHRLVVDQLPAAVETQVKSLLDDAVTKLKQAATPVSETVAAEDFTKGKGGLKGGRRETGFHPETGRPAGPGSW